MIQIYDDEINSINEFTDRDMLIQLIIQGLDESDVSLLMKLPLNHYIDVMVMEYLNDENNIDKFIDVFPHLMDLTEIHNMSQELIVMISMLIHDYFKNK